MTAATETTRSMTRGSRGQNGYEYIYPATRAGLVDREDIREALRKHFQTSYDILAGFRGGCERWVEDEWDKFHAERYFALKIFGLRVRFDRDENVIVEDA